MNKRKNKSTNDYRLVLLNCLNSNWPDEVSRSSDIHIKVKVTMIDWRKHDSSSCLDCTRSGLNQVWTESGLDWTRSGLNQVWTPPVCDQNSLSLLWSFTASLWPDSDLHVVSSSVSVILRCLTTDLICIKQENVRHRAVS